MTWAHKSETVGLVRCFLATVGHTKLAIHPPKSLIMHRVVCGKRGTVVYYLHCNYCIHHNFGGRGIPVRVNQWGVLWMKIRPPVASGRVERCRLFGRPLLKKREKWRTPICFGRC
jgi:hypothetical protein